MCCGSISNGGVQSSPAPKIVNGCPEGKTRVKFNGAPAYVIAKPSGRSYGVRHPGDIFCVIAGDEVQTFFEKA